MKDDIRLLLNECSRFNKKDQKRIEGAIKIAQKAHEGQTRKSDGRPYFMHPLAVAQLLVEWGADADTIITGLLHDTVEDTSIKLSDIKKEFGPTVTFLVEGVTKFNKADFEGKLLLSGDVETLRRLFEVMRKDIRVVIIKIADRLHNLRTIEGLPKERRVTFSKESLDIYYKIAFHLGMGEVCREITDISVPYVYPEKAAIRKKYRKEQKKFVCSAVKDIEKLLQKEMKKGSILEALCVESSQDLPRLNKDDESADRAYYCVIITNTEDSCYNTFKTLHEFFRPVRRKFHDYIASPPESGYRSLHTTIIGPHDKSIQIRIRTQKMHEMNNFGVLLSAFGEQEEKDDVQAFSWLQRSADLDRTTRESSEAFWEAMQTDIFKKSMQVTVDGEGVSLPLESTALDAAYFHLGQKAHKIKSITVNGRETELSLILSEDDVIETSVAKEVLVQFSWLDLVVTKYARNHITEALKEFDREERFNLGQELLQKELDHFQKILVGEIHRHHQKAIAEHFKRDTFEEVIVMIGEGVIQPSELTALIHKQTKKSQEKSYKFRLLLHVSDNHRDDIIPQIATIARLHDVFIGNIYMSAESKHGLIVMRLRGKSLHKHSYASFLSALERNSWISRLQTMISIRQKFTMMAMCSFAFVILFVEFMLLIAWKDWLLTLPYFDILLIQIILIVPPLIANFYALRILRNFVVVLRNDKWFFGLYLLLNVFVCILITYASFILGAYKNLLPLLVVFIFFMFYFIYRFIVTEQLMTKVERSSIKPLTKIQWQKLRRKKIIGYSFRMGAVTIWGIQPLYLKYTPANEVDPLIRVFLTGIGVLVITGIFMCIKELITRRPSKAIKLPKNILLANIIIGYILFTYFLNASLQFTTSTNFALLNNFSPVLALLVAAILWRSSIPYLRDPQKMLWIFLVFLMGSTGAALIIYNTMRGSSSGSLYGDTLGIFAMVADTFLVVSTIRYMKLHQKVSSLILTIYVFTIIILLLLPLMLWYYFTGNPNILSLTLVPILFGLGAGIFTGVGQILNLETFRRVDGFIAFLMFNISILITFVVEVYFLGQFKPSWILMVGGGIIIASTIIAELINSHCERKGL
jgi:GTP pyrophosphokinase